MIQFPAQTKYNLKITSTIGKGGIGKSTASEQIALATKNAVLNFLDPMADFSNIINNRKLNEEKLNLDYKPMFQSIYTNENNKIIDNLDLFLTEILDTVNPKNDDEGSDINLFVDLYGFEMTTHQEILEISDLILIPTNIGEYQEQSLKITSEMLSRISKNIGRELKAVAFLNRFSNRKTKNSKTELKRLVEFVDTLPNIVLLDEKISEREAFSAASNKGLSVFEVDTYKYSKAAKELKNLVNALGLPFAFEKNKIKGAV